MRNGHRFAAIALVLMIAAVFIAGSSHAADKKTNIQLALDQNINGEVVIKVQPRDAKIWRNKPDKPKKVEWPYSITVYACKDGVKAQKLATLDPRIIWQD
jgi:archaellum component FlaG (FlaF/FlaG flagellin family)